MATTNKLTGYGTITSAITTGFDALATDGVAISAALDNSSSLDMFEDLLFTVSYASAPSARGVVDVYLLPSVDGVNYPNGGVGTVPAPQYHVGSFGLLAQTGTQYAVIRGVPLPPGLFKYLAINKAGQTMAATNNTLQRRSYDLQSTP